MSSSILNLNVPFPIIFYVIDSLYLALVEESQILEEVWIASHASRRMGVDPDGERVGLKPDKVWPWGLEFTVHGSELTEGLLG